MCNNSLHAKTVEHSFVLKTYLIEILKRIEKITVKEKGLNLVTKIYSLLNIVECLINAKKRLIQSVLNSIISICSLKPNFAYYKR